MMREMEILRARVERSAGVRRGPFLRVTIFEFQRGLLYVQGRFARVLEPGRIWLRARDAFVRVIDVRPAIATIGGQEVLSSDGITLKVSLAVRFEFADLDLAFNRTEDAVGSAYLAVQIALREVIGTKRIDEVLEGRAGISAAVAEIATPVVAGYGVRLLAADVKDVMFPGEMRRVFAQVVEARQEGLAALERARGETAALRNLANVAELLERSPSLLRLRTLQAAAGAPNGTLVLHLSEQV